MSFEPLDDLKDLFGIIGGIGVCICLAILGILASPFILIGLIGWVIYRFCYHLWRNFKND